MSLDRSLKSGSGLGRHRNVLTRAERIGKLSGTGAWQEGASVYNLPKVGNRKLIIGGKAKKEEAAEGAAATPAAGAAAAPAAAKAAAPAAKPAAKK